MADLYFIYFCLFFQLFSIWLSPVTECHRADVLIHMLAYTFLRTAALPDTPPPHLSRFGTGSYAIVCNCGADDEVARVSTIHTGEQTGNLLPASSCYCHLSLDKVQSLQNAFVCLSLREEQVWVNCGGQARALNAPLDRCSIREKWSLTLILPGEEALVRSAAAAALSEW